MKKKTQIQWTAAIEQRGWFGRRCFSMTNTCNVNSFSIDWMECGFEFCAKNSALKHLRPKKICLWNRIPFERKKRIQQNGNQKQQIKLFKYFSILLCTRKAWTSASYGNRPTERAPTQFSQMENIRHILRITLNAN